MSAVRVAIDMGSSSVKVATSAEAGAAPTFQRIEHEPSMLDGVLQWQLDGLAHGVVARALAEHPDREVLVTVDGWGSDVAFLDARGRRIGPLRSYRDPSLAGAWAEVQRRGIPELVWQRTGSVITQDSTLTQLVDLQRRAPAWLSDVRTVLPIADYISSRLTGATRAGGSSLSTTAVLDPATGRVDRELLDLVGIPEGWFADPHVEGAEYGTEPMRGEPRVRVGKVAGHDTASALLAGYRGGPFVSLGSWAVVGYVCGAGERSDAPFRNQRGALHELSADGSLRLNRNVPGMRVLQRLAREWSRDPATVLPSISSRVSQPPLDVWTMDALPDGALSEWLAARGSATFDEQVHVALVAVAGGVAAAIGEFGASVPDGAAVWTCGGGSAVLPLRELIAAMTGREIEAGPVEASALGGLDGLEAIDYR